MKNIVMDGPKFGKLENYENVDETMSQSEERVCKSIMRGLVKHSHEKHPMLADGTGKPTCCAARSRTS